MKTALSLVVGVLISLVSIAQPASPQKIKYQGVVRNNNGEILQNKSVYLRIGILRVSPTGLEDYAEIHNVTTSSFGLFNVNIGEGQVVTGNFSNVKWGEYDYFQKLEPDTNIGDNYVLMGTTQFLSVPFSLVSNYSDSASHSNHSVHSDTATHVAYGGYNSMLVYDIPGIYYFTVPSDGNYTVEVWGAGSGCSVKSEVIMGETYYSGTPGEAGGYGKSIFQFTKGQVFEILVGLGGVGVVDGSSGSASGSGFQNLYIFASGGDAVDINDPTEDGVGGGSNGQINITASGSCSPHGGCYGQAPGSGGILDVTNLTQPAGSGANGRVIIYR